MRMAKIAYKLRPSDYWRIGEHESWFADLAQEGLHLKKMGLHFAQFVKGEPKQTRYRIDVCSSKNITPQQKEMYAESGWDYVTGYGNFNVFSSPSELKAPELHTDPAEQSFTLEELDKKFVISAIVVVVASLLSIGMISAVWFLDRTPSLVLVEGRIIQQSILVLLMVYFTYTSLQAATSIRVLRKNLLEGKPINHNAPWKKHHRITSTIAMIYIVVAVFGSILPMVQLVTSKTRTLPLVSNDLPIVRLANVEENSELVRKETYIRNDTDWGNRYSYNWSIFAPLQYQSDENGVIPNEMWEDGSGVYSPSMRTSVYRLSFSSMAESLVSDLTKRYGLAYRGGEFVRVEHPDFDILIVHEVDEFKEIFAARGKGVMFVRYHGYGDIYSIIDNIAKKINLISD